MSDTPRKAGLGFYVLSATLGAALAYFLDPRSGSGRRTMLTDQVGSLLGRSAGSAKSVAQSTAAQTSGMVQGAVPHQPDNPNPDDLTLRDRVESEILRHPKIKQSDVIFNVVNGVVELRGELPTMQDIDDLIAQVKSVPDVRAVASYLHLPNTPAPNKVDAIRASSSS